jgi:hypothetical protein
MGILRDETRIYAVFTHASVRCACRFKHLRGIPMELTFLTLAAALVVATLGLGALCARLMGRKS